MCLSRTVCGMGTVFCMASGRCQLAGQVCGRPPQTAAQCPRGTVYCMASGQCRPAGQGCGRSPSAIRCPPGSVYCMAEGRCLPSPCPNQVRHGPWSHSTAGRCKLSANLEAFDLLSRFLIKCSSSDISVLTFLKFLKLNSIMKHS